MLIEGWVYDNNMKEESGVPKKLKTDNCNVLISNNIIFESRLLQLETWAL